MLENNFPTWFFDMWNGSEEQINSDFYCPTVWWLLTLFNSVENVKFPVCYSQTLLHMSCSTFMSFSRFPTIEQQQQLAEVSFP